MTDSFPKKNRSSKLTKVLALALILAALGVTWALVKETYRKRQIQKEIALLQGEASRIVQENQTIQERIKYLESQDFQEREAKDKLNLRSPGEEVVIVKTEISNKSKEEKVEVAEVVELPETRLNNPQKWWYLFFSKN